MNQLSEVAKGDLKLAWTNLQEDHQPQEAEDLIDLVCDFQQNKLDSAKHNVIDWTTSLQE